MESNELNIGIAEQVRKHITPFDSFKHVFLFGSALKLNAIIAIQEIIKEYQRQKTNQRSRKGGSARKPQQYHAEAEVII